MPTNATDTDSWVANVQRPNNGELADSGSLSQGFNPLTQRSRHLYNKSRSALFDITRAPYNADPTGGSVSTTGIQAAIDAAAAAGGHVFSPAGNFRHGLLTIPSGVSIFGVPEKTFWLLDHATANGLVCLDPSDGNPVTIQDIRFLGNVAATGSHIVNNVDTRLHLLRCTWNGINSVGAPSNNLQGKILHSNSDLSETEFFDCRVKVAGDVNGLHAQRGKVTMNRGMLVMPATYNNSLLRAENTARVGLRGVDVDCRARAVGGGIGVMFVDAGVTAEMLDCQLDGTGASGTIWGFLWAAGARVTARATRWLGNITPYAGNTAIIGSSVELKDYLPAHPGAATTYTIPDGVRHVALAFNGTAPTLTMPAKLFAGQRLTVSIYNDASGGNWAGVTVIGLLFGGTNAINNNSGRSFEAVVVDRNLDGALDWVIVGPWSEMFA
jgi:hypothetical protein